MVNFIKMKNIYIYITCCLVFVNSFLFFVNKTYVFEFFYYPWLTQKGLFIYKEFFQNHGPLLYYLLAPLTLDKSLTLIKIFYTLVQSANLILILILIKKLKFSSVASFIIGGITFIILNFYFSYHYFWDEQIIATCYLLIYYFINSKEFSLKSATIGILIGLASIIKPNALIIAIPVLFFYKKKSFLFYPILIWLIVMLYFFLHNGFLQFIDNFIVFNFHYQNYYLKNFPYSSAIRGNWYFLNFLIVIFIFAIHSLNRKNINGKLLIFLLISASCFYPLVGADRFAPFTSFLAIFISYLFTITNRKSFFLIMLFFYLLSFSFQAKNKAERIQRLQMPIEDSRSQKIITYLKKENLYLKNFYIMSNNVEIYYLLDKPSKVYFPLMYPSISNYYKDFQKTYISDIKRNKIDLIIIPEPIDPNYSSASNLIAFIKTNYSLSHKDSDFLIYTRKIKQNF